MNRFVPLQAGFLILLLAVSSNVLLEAQLQYPGKPFGFNSQLKAADVMYVLPPVDPLEVEAEMEQNRQGSLKPFHFALERTVNLSPESSGSWSLEEDQRVWRVHLLSPGALSIGLVFGRYALLPGVKLFVYDPEQREVKGAFTSDNNKRSGLLPVGHISGEELIIEMQVPAEMGAYGDLELRSLSHAFLNAGYKSAEADCPTGEFGCSEPCEIDVNCVEGGGWQSVKSSVVRIYSSGFYCTGVLVNNTAYDGTPYILTAAHCLDRQEYTETSVFQFNYESAGCFGEDGPLDMSIAAGDLITTGDSVDFSLIRLSATPPASFGATYAGWDRSEFQSSSTASIHHPHGDVKKITIDSTAPSIPLIEDDVPYPGLQGYHYFSFWWIRQWDVGSTEGGSSGAPLFNVAQSVIGILSGGVAACGDSIGYNSETGRVIFDTGPNYDDYFARFGMAWDYEEDQGNALKPWLDPIHSGVITLGGYTPNTVEPFSFTAGKQCRVYPNPAQGLFYIESIKPISGTGYYSIVNLSGELVQRGVLWGRGPVEVNTTSLTPGLYIVTVEMEGFREHHKMMLTRQ